MAEGAQRLLDDRGQFRVRLHQVRELIDHHWNRAVTAEIEQDADRLRPTGEVERARRPNVLGQRRANAGQRLGVRCLGGTEIKTIGRLARGLFRDPFRDHFVTWLPGGPAYRPGHARMRPGFRR